MDVDNTESHPAYDSPNAMSAKFRGQRQSKPSMTPRIRIVIEEKEMKQGHCGFAGSAYRSYRLTAY